MLPLFQTVAPPPLTKTCGDAWSGYQGSVLKGEAAFPPAPHGPLYLLIYFPDCCLTFLELLPPQLL